MQVHQCETGGILSAGLNKLAKISDRNGGATLLPINIGTWTSRIMIDAQQFRKIIPSCPRFFTKKSDVEVDLASLFVSSMESSSPRVKGNGPILGETKEDDLLICSPTVMRFSFADKFWGKCIGRLLAFADPKMSYCY